MRGILADLTAIAGETRWLGHLKSLKNVYNNFEKISEHLENDLYSASSLKPLFNSLKERQSIFDAIIKVLGVIKKPLVILQAS